MHQGICYTSLNGISDVIHLGVNVRTGRFPKDRILCEKRSALQKSGDRIWFLTDVWRLAPEFSLGQDFPA